MRSLPILALIALAGCGEPVRDDHFANDSEPARAPEVTTTSAAAVRIGELGPSFNACPAAGTTRHVAAGEELGVLAAPLARAEKKGSLPAGARFFICSRSLDQKWFGIVYDGAGTMAAHCGVIGPVPTKRNYDGPCASGWVSSALVKLIAGNEELPPAAVEAPPAG